MPKKIVLKCNTMVHKESGKDKKRGMENQTERYSEISLKLFKSIEKFLFFTVF